MITRTAADPADPDGLGILVPPSLPPSKFVEFVIAAESYGFDEIWVAEDCFSSGGVAQASVALASTQRIAVGVGILPAGARNVVFVALDVAFLATVYPGRLMVGIGHGMAGWMRQAGVWTASPLGLLGEYLDALRRLLRGERLSVDGRYVTLSDVHLDNPPSVPPPVLAGVRGPKSLAVSGRYADGTILAEPVTPEYLQAARSQLRARAGHDIVAYNVAAVDNDPDAARTQVRPALSWVGHLGPG